MNFTSRQACIFTLIALAHLGCGLLLGLQAPFYPAVASAKGVSATVYGLVFGVFQLTVFFTSPFFGQYIPVIGCRFMLVAGMFTMGTTCILFGFLDYMNDKNTFTVFSFLIRITEGIGNASYITSSFSLATQEFSTYLSTMIAILEVFFGAGLAIGPTVGGALYELGGFVCPFVTIGALLVLSALVTGILLPETETTTPVQSEYTVPGLLEKPEMLISFLTVITSMSNIGFLDATLEPHLRQFSLSPGYIGLFFLITGLMYSLSAPVFGVLNDKWYCHRYLILCGSFLVVVAFLLMGPAPFVPLTPCIPLIIFSLFIQGIGFGALNVSSFVGAQRDAVLLGLPDDLSTFGLVSALWTSGLAFGAFTGPTIGGCLLDYFGFRWATVFVFAYNSLLLLANVLFILYRKVKPHKKTVPLFEDPLVLTMDSLIDYGSVKDK